MMCSGDERVRRHVQNGTGMSVDRPASVADRGRVKGPFDGHSTHASRSDPTAGGEKPALLRGDFGRGGCACGPALASMTKPRSTTRLLQADSTPRHMLVAIELETMSAFTSR
eukprot:scaffold6057_cov112-Isochrysis_galbana.AAC.2